MYDTLSFTKYIVYHHCITSHKGRQDRKYHFLFRIQHKIPRAGRLEAWMAKAAQDLEQKCPGPQQVTLPRNALVVVEGAVSQPFRVVGVGWGNGWTRQTDGHDIDGQEIH